jgi:hypothetical protein
MKTIKIESHELNSKDLEEFVKGLSDDIFSNFKIFKKVAKLMMPLKKSDFLTNMTTLFDLYADENDEDPIQLAAKVIGALANAPKFVHLNSEDDEDEDDEEDDE